MVRHTAQAGNQPVAAAEEARRATTGRVWTTFMVGGRECLRKLGTRLMAMGLCESWFCLGNEDLGNAMGEEGQFEAHGASHTGNVCLSPDGTTDRRGIDDHSNRKRLTRQG